MPLFIHDAFPVLLPEAVFKQLAAAKHGTLKEFLAAPSVLVDGWFWDDSGLDMDTPEDFQKAWGVFIKESYFTIRPSASARHRADFSPVCISREVRSQQAQWEVE